MSADVRSIAAVIERLDDAAPLGIVYSRRAVLASVASSIFIFFGYLFLMFLFLALESTKCGADDLARRAEGAVLDLIADKPRHCGRDGDGEFFSGFHGALLIRK